MEVIVDLYYELRKPLMKALASIDDGDISRS